MSHTKEFILAQNGSYPECKSDIYEVELLPLELPLGCKIGFTASKLFLVVESKCLVYGQYMIIDRRNYTQEDYQVKLEQLIKIAHE